MYLPINIAFIIAIVFGIRIWTRRKSSFPLIVIALIIVAACVYNSVRWFASSPIDEQYLVQIASASPELEGYELDFSDFVWVDRRPLSFRESNGDFDTLVEILSEHPWHNFSEFHVFTQWHSKDSRVVAVLMFTRAKGSFFFSSAPALGANPDAIGAAWFIPAASLEAD